MEERKRKNEAKMLKNQLESSRIAELSLRKDMMRSQKPITKKKKQDILSQYTQDEIDYLLYVEGITPNTLRN